MTNKKLIAALRLCACLFIFLSCGTHFKDDYKDNSPTSGRLKVYYDQGLSLHIKNQAYTFQALYPKAMVELVEAGEQASVQALLNDSCEAIILSRKLSEQESKVFAGRQYTPGYSPIVISAVALIANIESPIKMMEIDDLKNLLQNNAGVKDSLGNSQQLTVLFDHNNSSVLHYMLDTVLRSRQLSSNCRILNSTLEGIEYVAANKNAMALIDFAWLSDVDDPLWKKMSSRIKFIALGNNNKFEYPNQSSLKLNTYPLARTVYYYRKTGEFTLAKGFEAFMAGPKGQMTFLKQGLMPTRQWERNIEVKIEKQ